MSGCGLVAQVKVCHDRLRRISRGGEIVPRACMRASIAGDTCRAAADDLNTALGGELKLTAFGDRLPLELREEEAYG